MEKRCFANEQYSRRECFELIGIPANVEQDKLEETVLNLFSKIDCVIPVNKIEAVHRIGRENKKVIVKVSHRKDAEKIRKNRKKLKDVDGTVYGLQKKVLIFDSLCQAYGSLRYKCKQLWDANHIHSFWVSGGKVFLKIKDGEVSALIDHECEITKLFPNIDFSQP